MKSYLLLLSFITSTAICFLQQQVEIDGFILASTNSNTLILTLPESYEGESDLDVWLDVTIWSKKMWDLKLKDGSGYAQYTYANNGYTSAETFTKTYKAFSDVYILSIEIKNRLTGEFTLYHKLLDTRAIEPGEIEDDGFSIRFIPK